MLYWATKPDPLFTKIVDVAISVGRDLVRTWEGSSSTEWATMYPGLAKFFTPATSNRDLERLPVAHGSSKGLSGIFLPSSRSCVTQRGSGA